jgi:hypothetical protein
MAFKTAYTLQQKRRDNDQKVISLFVEMKDIMGVLLLYAFLFIHGHVSHISQLKGRKE